MRYTVIACLAVALLVLIPVLAQPAAPAPSRAPVAMMAEKGFFEAFNGGAADRGAPLRLLMAAWATDPNDARTNLLLGLNHLWMAAEGDRNDPRVIENLLLSEHFLARAERLNPADRRIPSWLVPVRLSLAGLERQPEKREELVQGLLAAYAEDPVFHSFSVALLSFGEPRGSEGFARGLEALRQAEGDCQQKEEGADMSCQNTPHWPHNREAFVTFRADYELKAGHPEKAREILEHVRQMPSYPGWSFRSGVEDRLQNLEAYAKLYANDDPKDDPPSLMSMESRAACQSCHRG
ncbi:MAG TPA: hypothetical protein VJ725_11825 [Thermoanaerobaculia bacterium]|nr:hypothetical protein [Thermoanaerobaculia bacterium]